MAGSGKKVTFGLIVGNRGFFPDMLAKEGREVLIALLEKLGYGVIAPSPEETKFGCVETWAESRKCADLFRARRDDIDGVIVTLPNFGEERGIADALKLADLNVPVLIHAWDDSTDKMTSKCRRDSFCGKMSACNNLKQYGIPYTLTRLHTMAPETPEFEEELHFFAAVCRVVGGLSKCRVGAIGARPAAFNTVRYSEKLLEESGISVATLDLSEVFGRAARLTDTDAAVKERLAAIQTYVQTKHVPTEALLKMAKLAVVVQEWMRNDELDITAVQCWTSLEEYYGVVPCTVMSMLSDQLRSSACEVDVCGAVAMHALALASGTPSFLLDWNNNYGTDPNKCVCFHCSNLPKSVFEESTMDYQEIIAGAVGKASSYGTIVGRIKAGPMTYCRVSTLDTEGQIGAYVGEGRFTTDTLSTFGGYGVAEIPNMQGLLQYICRNGFEHHVAASHSRSARAVDEAFDTYFGWDVYRHM